MHSKKSSLISEVVVSTGPANEEVLERLRRRAEAARPKRMPSMARRAVNLAKAGGLIITAVATDSRIVLDEETVAARRAKCEACPGGWWKPEAYGGRGGCAHPRCGCTGIKRWLATEQCPIGAWGH